MDTVGNGTGTKDAQDTDGSSTPVIFKIKPAAGEIFRIERLIISMVSSSNSMGVGYGGGTVVLTNGFELKVITGAAGGSTIWDITDGIPIKVNHDWKNLCFDENTRVYGATNAQVSYRYTFAKDGCPIILEGDNSDELQLICNDDIGATGINITEHLFRIGMTQIK
jgi:hypothetical protein